MPETEAVGKDYLTELSVLYEISSTPTSQISFEELGRLLLDKATRLLGTPVAVLYSRVGDDRPLELWAAEGMPVEEIRGVSTENRVITQMLTEGQPVLLDGRDAVQALGVLPANYPAHWGLCLPIRARDAVAGVLCTFRLTDSPFTRTEVALFKVLADRTRAALEMLQLFAEAEQRQRVLEQEIAERKRAEKALQRERGKAQQYLRVANVIIVALDAEGKITLVNRKACEVLGYEEDELVGKDWFTICLPARIRDEVRTIFKQLMAGEIELVEHFENPVLTRSGEERLISWHNTLLTDEAGRITGTLSSGEDITERKRTEQALRESEERFRKQFEEALDAIFVADAETGILVDCNRAACELVGREKSELVGEHQRVLHPPETIEGEFSRTFREHLQEKAGQVLETQIVTREGEIRDVAIKASLFEIGGRRVLQGIFRDITERKRAEERLARRAAQLALLNDIGRQIAALTDLNTVLERAARLVQENFGYHHVGLFTVDHEKGRLVMRARAGKFVHLFPLEHWLELGQGMVGWVGAQGKTLLANDVDAEPRYVNLYPDIIPTKSELSVPIRVGQEIVGVLDVQSDQRNAFSENDVRVLETLADQIAVAIENARLYERVRKVGESEHSLRERLGALHEVSIELSKAPTFDDLCRQAVELGRSRLGFDRLGIWFLDQDRQFLVGSFGTDEKGQLRDERGSRLPVAIQEASMTILTSRASLVFEPDEPLRDGAGTIVGRGWLAIAAIRDAEKVIGYISADNLLRSLPVDEHQLEILKLYGITLGHLCTRKRAEEALAQKAQELARSNADLQHFAYIASHDLQEPLRMVTSYLQLLERRYKEQFDTDAREFIAYAVDGVTRMQGLINALLSYSRVGTRGKPFAPTDCAVILERALTNLKVAIEESNAVVTHDPLPTVMADDVQLTQVFQNLIGNAVKFRGKRTPQVHVGAQRGKGEWIFSVRDNGIGIDPQHFERIFMIFQRLHTQDEYPGAGIGLAVCKKIVERHGGRIWVESLPGQGSTFYFTIPDRGGTS